MRMLLPQYAMMDSGGLFKFIPPGAAGILGGAGLEAASKCGLEEDFSPNSIAKSLFLSSAMSAGKGVVAGEIEGEREEVRDECGRSQGRLGPRERWTPIKEVVLTVVRRALEFQRG